MGSDMARNFNGTIGEMCDIKAKNQSQENSNKMKSISYTILNPVHNTTKKKKSQK